MRLRVAYPYARHQPGARSQQRRFHPNPLPQAGEGVRGARFSEPSPACDPLAGEGRVRVALQERWCRSDHSFAAYSLFAAFSVASVPK
jgi:hypothetical protein